ncbi:MAG: hypothetical protein JXX28_07205 [Deltaproteobacteria bacterium]|nr:hypothetical protein [Deltaproteobacteria bacterium]
MGEMITKPDANPILFLLLNLFVLGGLGYFLMGQKKKAIIAIVITVVLYCFGLGFITQILFAYDAYLLAQKLQAGEQIGENQNGLSFLDAIFKD